MHITGLCLLFVAAPLLWLASFVPFLGVLAYLPFSDCALAGVALTLAGLIPAGPRWRAGIAVVLWALLSLSLVIAAIPEHLKRGGLLWPQVRVDRIVRVPRGAPVSVHGDAGAWLSAWGPRSAVSGEINVAGMRASAGEPLVNRAETVEPVELLWRRGLVPDIEGAAFPRLTIERNTRGDWTDVHLFVEAAQGEITARFRRSYPMPLPDMGMRQPALERALLSILHDNLLRMVLGLQDRYDPQREIGGFLFDALGGAPFSPQTGTGPLRKVSVLSEKEVPAAPGPAGIEGVLAALVQPGAERLRDLRENPCGKRVFSREYGADGWRTDASLMESGTPGSPIVLGHVMPGHAAFAWYCDTATGRLLSFMGASWSGVGLRITGYTPDGRIAEVHFLESPAKELWRGAVPAGTLSRGPNGQLHFAFALPIPEEAGRRKAVQDKYRVLELEAAPLR